MTDDLIAALKAGRMTLPRDAVIALEAQARRISELEEENRRLMHSFMRVDLLRGEQSARIAELEAALKPFADCEVWEGYKDEETFISGLKIGDLRAARAALEKKE